MTPEELMIKLKASKQLIKETEGVRSVNGQVIKEKPKSKPRKQVVEEDFDPTPFRVDKSGDDDEYMPDIPYKTANYQPKPQSAILGIPLLILYGQLQQHLYLLNHKFGRYNHLFLILVSSTNLH